MFAPIEIKWNGESFSVPSNRVMMAIATVEEVVTMFELIEWRIKGRPSLSRMSMAYGALLRFAGCQITDEEVFSACFEKMSEGDGDVMLTLYALLNYMIPQGKEPPKGNLEKVSQTTAESRDTDSPKKRLRSQSRKNG